MPEEKLVVLGLLSTKSSRLETFEELAARVRQAARFFPEDRLAISPQCGFSSSILGNRLSVEDQRRKLRLVVDAARRLWS